VSCLNVQLLQMTSLYSDLFSDSDKARDFRNPAKERRPLGPFFLYNKFEDVTDDRFTARRAPVLFG